MSTNLDELSPFDMQVLNMAQLQKGALEWTQTTLCIPHIGTLEVVKDGRLQLRQSDKPSRWCRALSPHGQAALAKLHWELLTSAIDTDERDADLKAQRDAQLAEMRMNMGLPSSLQSAAAAQQAQMRALNNQMNQLTGIAAYQNPAPAVENSKSHVDDALRYGIVQKLRDQFGL